ncbi:MAG TPA: DUF3592 domain-containing protein [Edaphobacter sp.]|nr:DUF3592 domain-containing protein [Edaphobacter sp.]
MASLFEQARFKLHGAQSWPWADATVFDCILGEPGRRGYRRAELSYSFWIDGHIYSGVAVWQDFDSGTFSKNDVIQIQYNPADPNESYFPERESPATAFLLTLIGSAIALAVIVWIGISLFRLS